MDENKKSLNSTTIMIPLMGIIILVLLAVILAMMMLGRSPAPAAAPTFTIVAAQPPTQTQPPPPTLTVNPVGGTPDDAVKSYYSSLRNANIGIVIEEWTTTSFSQRLNSDKEYRDQILDPKKGVDWLMLKIAPVEYSSFQMALVQYTIDKKDQCELLELANPQTTGNHWRVAEVSEADCITGEKIAIKAPTATPVEHFVFQFTQEWCFQTYGSRLFPNMAATVSTDPPIPNNLRSAPGKQEPRIGELAPGEEVRILSGPRCVDGWIWWEVRSMKNGERGWTSEGDENGYWLVPSRMPGS